MQPGGTMQRGPSSTYVISLTPFTAEHRLDEPALRRHLQRMASAGIGVYLGGSGSGEGYTLSMAEQRRVLEIGVEELSGRVPVRAMGVEPRTAAQMIDFGGLAADAGVDAMQCYSLDQGHGNHPTPKELERYLCDVLEAAQVPVVLSSHQAVGYFIPPSLIGWLLDRFDNVVGVNTTSPDVSYLLRMIEAIAGRAEVHVGGPMLALTCLALGGQGYLSSDGNLAPRLCVSVVERWDEGDFAGAADAYRRLIRLFAATRDHGGIVATKAALGLLGLAGGWPRPPRLAVPDDQLPALRAEMIDSIGLFDIEGFA
jgi:4-hydroxy-tetrahydrodipicolinate synthase